MSVRLFGRIVGSAALLSFWLLSPLSTVAQDNAAGINGAAPAKSENGKKASSKKWCIGCSVDGKTTPRTSDGHPDLSGFWDNPFAGIPIKRPDGTVGFLLGAPKDPNKPAPVRVQPTQPSYKPEYAAKVKETVDGTSYGPTSLLDPLQHCKPPGVPRATVAPLHIVQTPNLVVILYEPDAVGTTFRMIYTDGRPHPEDVEETYMGDSIGHWEGDTLVVDVVGLNDETWLGGGQQSERYAGMHSNKEHVIERYTRNGDVLTYEATVDDPVVLAKPWVITPRHIRHGGPDDRLLGDSYCENHDLPHIVAPVKWDLSVLGPNGAVAHTLIVAFDQRLATGEAPVGGTLDGNAIEGTTVDDKINFSVKVQTPNGPVTQEFVGTTTEDSMKGTVKTGDTRQDWSATISKK